MHPLCIVSWKLVYSYVSLCMCSSHPACGPTPCVECVHASAHVFMSILLPTLTQPPMDSYLETLVPLCFTVHVPVTLLVFPHLV